MNKVDSVFDEMAELRRELEEAKRSAKDWEESALMFAKNADYRQQQLAEARKSARAEGARDALTTPIIALIQKSKAEQHAECVRLLSAHYANQEIAKFLEQHKP